MVAEMSVINPFDFFLEPHAEEIPFDLRSLAASRTDALPVQAAGDAAIPEIPRRHLAREDAQR
jgi:hypothetical protein